MEETIETFIEGLIKKDPPKEPINKRRIKRNIKKRASALIPNVTYAMGCRGHPGLVTKRSYWPGWSLQDLFGASVEITSLVDGIEEGCSIYHCSPMPISKEKADKEIERLKQFENKGVTNPRMVDMLTYPTPIKSFTI